MYALLKVKNCVTILYIYDSTHRKKSRKKKLLILINNTNKSIST